MELFLSEQFHLTSPPDIEAFTECPRGNKHRLTKSYALIAKGALGWVVDVCVTTFDFQSNDCQDSFVKAAHYFSFDRHVIIL
jgi:hypothetical protein